MYSLWTAMLVARVRATESRTLGTGSQLRSRRCGKTSHANNSSESICFTTSWEQSRAKVWRRFHRLLWANHSARSASRLRSKTGSVDTCFTSSVTSNITNKICSLANSRDARFFFVVKESFQCGNQYFCGTSEAGNFLTSWITANCCRKLVNASTNNKEEYNTDVGRKYQFCISGTQWFEQDGIIIPHADGVTLDMLHQAFQKFIISQGIKSFALSSFHMARYLSVRTSLTLIPYLEIYKSYRNR